MFKPGDIVTPRPFPPIRGEVVKVHENGFVDVKWPSGYIQTHETKKVILYDPAQWPLF